MIIKIDPAKLIPTLEQQQAARAEAYSKEADPMYFQVARGKVAEKEWLSAIAEIKKRFPYPEV